jgi:hypothetical protein
MEELSNSATFLWGAVGGAAGYALVFLLPWLTAVAKGEVSLDFSWTRLLGVIGLFFVYISLGGVAALLVGEASEIKHAIAYGLGFEGVLKGAAEAIK